MSFEPLESYRIDPNDHATRGRLMHAAQRGDARAKLTLRELKSADKAARTPEAEQARAAEQQRQRGALQAGRALFNSTAKAPREALTDAGDDD